MDFRDRLLRGRRGRCETCARWLLRSSSQFNQSISAPKSWPESWRT